MIRCLVSHRLSHESKSSTNLKSVSPMQQTVSSVRPGLAARGSWSSFCCVCNNQKVIVTSGIARSFLDGRFMNMGSAINLGKESFSLEEMLACGRHTLTQLVLIVAIVMAAAAKQIYMKNIYSLKKEFNKQVQELGLLEPSELFQALPYDVFQRKSQAIKKSVKQALSMVASLQRVVSDLWQALSSEALAALNVAPEDIQHYLSVLSTMNSKLCNCNEHSPAPSHKNSMCCWSQRLQVSENVLKLPSQGFSDYGASSLPVIQDVNFDECSSSSSLAFDGAQCKPQGIKIDLASTIGIAVREAVDTLVASLEDHNPQPGFAYTSTESVVEQLLGELEKAASKVAGLEAQLISLKEYAKTSETKRQQAEQKIVELIEYDLRNQAKAHEDMAELTRMLRSKETDCEELLYKQKLLVAVKAKEHAELQDNCMKKDNVLRALRYASQVAKESSEQKLAAIEDICRRKDNIIASLKRQIMFSENKVSELQSLQEQSRQQKTPSKYGKSNPDQTDEHESTYRSVISANSLKAGYEVTPGKETEYFSDTFTLCDENACDAWAIAGVINAPCHILESTGSTENIRKATLRLDMSMNSDCKSKLFCKSPPIHTKSRSSGTKPKKKDSSSQRCNGILTGVATNTPIDSKKPSSDKREFQSTPNGKLKENAVKRRL